MVDGVRFLSPHQNIACNWIPSTLRHDMVRTTYIVLHAVGATHSAGIASRRINANELRLWTQCDGLAAWPKRNEFGLVKKTWKMFCSRYSNSRVWWRKGDGSIEHVRPTAIKWISSLFCGSTLHFTDAVRRYVTCVGCILRCYRLWIEFGTWYIRFNPQSFQLGPQHCGKWQIE